MSLRGEIIRILNQYLDAVKISELPAGTTPSGNELIEVVQGGTSVRLTVSQVSSGGVGVLSVVAGTNISVDNTDPQNPIVSSTGGGGGGTVTSVGLVGITGLINIGGSASPITTSGEYELALETQNANEIFAGPASGGAAAPAFRSLVAADIPDLSGTYYLASNPNGYTSNAGTVTSVSFTGGLISVANATTTPALTVAGTSGGIPYFSSASTWASSGALAANALMIGGGAGAAPSTTTTGTGVLTFLGTPSWTNFNSMITGTAPFWALTGTSTLTGTTVIANGGNALTFSGAAQFLINNTVEDGFRVTGSFTAADSFAQAATFAPTVTGRGTSNDAIVGTYFNPTLTNSTGVAVSQIGVRIQPSFTGSVISGPLQTSLQVIGGSSTALTRIFVGLDSAGIERFALRGNGSFTLTSTLTGTEFGGAITTLTTGNGHILHSCTIPGPSSSGGTVYHQKYTGGITTNSITTTYHDVWDARSHTVNHTGAIISGYFYEPSIGGSQAGTETHYAFRIASGLSGFQAASNAPTAVVQIGAVTTDRASLRIEAGATTTAPSSPNSGDIWHEGTGNRLMFRQGAASNEIICASAVTTEAVVSDTTVTIKLNNVTYKLLARA